MWHCLVLVGLCGELLVRCSEDTAGVCKSGVYAQLCLTSSILEVVLGSSALYVMADSGRIVFTLEGWGAFVKITYCCCEPEIRFASGKQRCLREVYDDKLWAAAPMAWEHILRKPWCLISWRAWEFLFFLKKNNKTQTLSVLLPINSVEPARERSFSSGRCSGPAR